MRWISLIAALVAFAFAALVVPASAQTIVAPESSDPGEGAFFLVSKSFDTDDGTCDADCSLREAITAANGTPGPDVIQFGIPGPGVQTLLLQLGPLPSITQPLLIDGTTQDDASCDDWPPQLRLELDGSALAGFPDGLRFAAGSAGSEVRGLSIVGFENFGIALDSDTSDTGIFCNYLGVEADGNTAAGNGIGIFADGSGHRIGDNIVGEANVISGNVGAGITIFGDQVEVQGNLIGVNTFGTAPLGNSMGINLSGADNLIGGGVSGDRNIISANNGVGIVVGVAEATRILGNVIGTDASGSSLTLGNGTWGILVATDSGSVQIGSTAAGTGNLISNNGSGAVLATNGDAGFGSDATTLENNFLGTSGNGETTLAGGLVQLEGEGHVIGGDDPDSRNVTHEIRVLGSFNRVLGNHICWSLSGLAQLDSCPIAVTLGGSNNVIGGSTGNLIGGTDAAVEATDPGPENVISNNVIGLDIAGQPAVAGPNFGIFLQRLDIVMPAETVRMEGNVISNCDIGIRVIDHVASILGNRIGTGLAGLAAIPNEQGIVYTRSTVDIGGAADGEGNLISGNSGAAIVGENSIDGNIGVLGIGASIVGNFIGTDITGLAALPNGAGVVIPQPGTVVIGGTEPEDGNVISGNIGDGISLSDDCSVVTSDSSVDHFITHNLIGVGQDGVTPLGNGGLGIALEACPPAGELRGVFIGQQVVGQQGLGNVISSNLIGIRTRNVTFSRIVGNFIGTDRSGSLQLGNTGDGIRLDSSSEFVIGDDFLGEGEGNVISFNGGQGVIVTGEPFSGTAVVGNSIRENGGLGIDLLEPSTGDGVVTPNDFGDLDTTADGDGPHDLQNFPEISSAESLQGETTVVGALNSLPNSTYFVEIFANSTCDPSGHGEAESSLGLLVLSTDDNGEATIDVTFPVALMETDFITAVAIDSINQTSEISPCVGVVGPLPTDIPTLGTWGIALLSALLGLSAITLLRRQTR